MKITPTATKMCLVFFFLSSVTIGFAFEALFDYPKTANKLEWHWEKQTSEYMVYKGTLQASDPQHNGNYSLTWSLYKSKLVEKGPLIIQLPPIGGTGILDEIIGASLAHNGMHSLVLPPDQYAAKLNRPLEDLDPYFIRNTISVRQALDVFSTLPFVDPDKIGSIGVSLGGIRSSYLLAAERRIKKGIIIIGGGNMPNILAYSNEGGVEKYRHQKMKELNTTDPKVYYQAILQSHRIDPLDVAPFIGAERLSMVIAGFDTMVQTANQFRLWHAAGKPNHIWIPSGHLTSAIFLGPILQYSISELVRAF